MVRYIFDGSFLGLLTCIFEAYERKHKQVKIIQGKYIHTDIFASSLNISTDVKKAERVWKGLKTKVSANNLREYYCAFLSESEVTHQHLFDYSIYVFDHKKGVSLNFGNDSVLHIEQMAHRVNREKHRMKAFIRFKKSNNGLYFAIIKPDYNVIPLISSHFKNRYADQPWLIYDEQRKYGIYYDLHSVNEVTLNFESENLNLPVASSDIEIDTQEELYNILWKDYFSSTNIKERKNQKLHVQHVPKRYWKYLTEKLDFT